jgi:hypothetical protein
MLLVIAGVNDTPVGEALQIHDELEVRGVPPDPVPRMIGHAIAFLRQHLQGK